MKYYGFGAQFPESFVPGGKDLVIQYEVRTNQVILATISYNVQITILASQHTNIL
jgi:hypothetical protein